MTPTIVPLTAELGARVQGMTFPAYRHLLDLRAQPRHPELEETRLVQPLGCVALDAGQPIGLALGETPLATGDAQPPQLLSVFVAPPARRRGVAAALVEAFEAEVASRGFGELGAVYTTGKPAIEWMERLFAKRGWDEPTPGSLSVRFEPAVALTSPGFEPRRIAKFARGLEIFPWSEITEEENEVMRRSNEEVCWIEPSLNPWQFDWRGLDHSSVGARYEGRVVGWVLNHRVIPGVVRWSVSYMRRDLSRRGRIMPLLQRSLEMLVEEGRTQYCTFITPFSYPNMIRFIRRWITPISASVEESRLIRRSLTARETR